MGLGGLGMGELILLFLVVLLLFGAKRLPEIGSSLGKGIREFKGSMKEIERELTVPEPERQIHRTHSPPGESLDQPSEEGEPRKLSDGVASGSSDEQR